MTQNNTAVIPYFSDTNNSNLDIQPNPEFDQNKLIKTISQHNKKILNKNFKVLVTPNDKTESNFLEINDLTNNDKTVRAHNMIPVFLEVASNKKKQLHIRRIKTRNIYAGNFKLDQQHKMELQNMLGPTTEDIYGLSAPLDKKQSYSLNNIGKK